MKVSPVGLPLFSLCDFGIPQIILVCGCILVMRDSHFQMKSSLSTWCQLYQLDERNLMISLETMGSTDLHPSQYEMVDKRKSIILSGIFTFTENFSNTVFPFLWIMGPRFYLADLPRSVTARPSHARPEWARDPSITDSDSGGSSSSDPDSGSGSGWPAGVASYLASPARHVTASLQAWLLSSQPAVHPRSIRLRSGPRTLGKVCGQHNSSLDLLATCSPLSENQFSTSWGICWLIFLTSKYLFLFVAQGG